MVLAEIDPGWIRTGVTILILLIGGIGAYFRIWGRVGILEALLKKAETMQEGLERTLKSVERDVTHVRVDVTKIDHVKEGVNRLEERINGSASAALPELASLTKLIIDLNKEMEESRRDLLQITQSLENRIGRMGERLEGVAEDTDSLRTSVDSILETLKRLDADLTRLRDGESTAPQKRKKRSKGDDTPGEMTAGAGA